MELRLWEDWLCLLPTRASQVSATLSQELGDRLQEWVRKGINLVREENEAGNQLLQTLSAAVSRTGMIQTRVHRVLSPLHQTAEAGQSVIVRIAAIQALGKLQPLDTCSLTILNQAAQEDQPLFIREKAIRTLDNLRTSYLQSIEILNKIA